MACDALILAAPGDLHKDSGSCRTVSGIMMRLRPVVGLLAGLVVMSSSAAMAQAVSSSDARLHARLVTLDTHLETPANLERGGFDIMRAHPEQGPFSQVDVPRMRAGGLDGGFWVIFTPQGPLTAAG